MKNFFLTLSLLLLTVSVINAQKCKPKTVTDDFYDTKIDAWGATLTSMSVYSFNIKYLPSMYVYKDGNDYKIAVGIAIDGKIDKNMVLNDHKWFPKGSKFMFKLGSEILTFTVEESTVRQTYAEVISTISKADIEKIINQPFLIARVNAFSENENDLFFKFKVAKGRDKKVKQQLKCLLGQ